MTSKKTLDRVALMTQKRIQLAKWCGWTKIAMREFHLYDAVSGIPPNGGKLQCLPSYFTDLNACEEFQRLLRERWLWREWLNALRMIVCEVEPATIPSAVTRKHEWLLVTATAAQRCEAMLAVLDGLDGESNG